MNVEMRDRDRRLVGACALVVLLGAMLAVWSAAPAAHGFPLNGDVVRRETDFRDADDDLGLIQEVLRKIRENYLLAIDPIRLAVGAIEGMARAAGGDRIVAERKGDAVRLQAGEASVLLPLSRDETNNRESLKAAHRFIHRNAPPAPLQELTYGSIDGILEQLDAHSSFMPPDVYREMQLETQGTFGGIGIQVAVKDRQLTVVTPIEGTPADRAGLQPGDRILRIDGAPAPEMTLSEAVRRLRGSPGTKVTLTMLREDSAGPFQVTLIRQTITSKPIGSVELEHRIGYIRVRSFSEQSGRDLQHAAHALSDKGVRGLILDLRGNRGGLFQESIRTAELFLGPAQPVVTTTSRHRSDESRYITRHGGPFPKVSMIVVVDGLSASASEIVVGAFQDLKRALIVGSKTYGKGSVQTIIPLSDGSALRLTTAKYLTPQGRSIEGIGIAPDLVVEDYGTKRPSSAAEPEEPAYGKRRERSRIIRERQRKIAEEEGDPSVVIGRRETTVNLAEDKPLAVAWHALHTAEDGDPDMLLAAAKTFVPLQRGAVLVPPVSSTAPR